MPSLPGLTWPLTRRGPIFDTAREISVSGKTARYPRRTNPKWQWELSFDALWQQRGSSSPQSNTDMYALGGFFSQLYGAAYPFLYYEPGDGSVTNQLFGTGDGSTKNFQLVRTMGGFSERVQAVVGTPSVTVSGVAKTLGVDYTISSSGVVQFIAAPANLANINWTGSFYWVCEFDDDQIDFSQLMTGLYSVKKLTFTSKIL